MTPSEHRGWIRRLVDDLSGRSSRRIVQLLLSELDTTRRAVGLAESLARGEMTPTDARKHAQQLEHDGDDVFENLSAEAQLALVTPLDIEDVFRIARSIDDVHDNLRDFMREAHLYEPERLDFALPLLKALGEGLGLLHDAVAAVTEKKGDPRGPALRAAHEARQVRLLYQHDVAEVLHQTSTPDTLKRRELLRRLDVTGLRLIEAANALNDAAIKRGR